MNIIIRNNLFVVTDSAGNDMACFKSMLRLLEFVNVTTYMNQGGLK